MFYTLKLELIDMLKNVQTFSPHFFIGENWANLMGAQGLLLPLFSGFMLAGTLGTMCGVKELNQG